MYLERACTSSLLRDFSLQEYDSNLKHLLLLLRKAMPSEFS